MLLHVHIIQKINFLNAIIFNEFKIQLSLKHIVCNIHKLRKIKVPIPIYYIINIIRQVV